jgi:hypothetical protein
MAAMRTAESIAKLTRFGGGVRGFRMGSSRIPDALWLTHLG